MSSSERLEFLLDLVAQNPSPDELNREISRYERRLSRQKCNLSEKRGSIFLRGRNFVSQVEKSSPSENIYGIDSWITFKHREKDYVFPIQFKSSFQAVQEYKRGSSYLILEKKVIVLNVNRWVSRTDIRKQLCGEINRVLNLTEYLPLQKTDFLNLLTKPRH